MADTKPSLPRLDYTPRVSRERELFGDDLDYFDYNSHIWHRTKRAILRAVKPINPFAIHHDSTDDHVGRRCSPRLRTQRRTLLLPPRTLSERNRFLELLPSPLRPSHPSCQRKKPEQHPGPHPVTDHKQQTEPEQSAGPEGLPEIHQLLQQVQDGQWKREVR